MKAIKLLLAVLFLAASETTAFAEGSGMPPNPPWKSGGGITLNQR